MDDHGLRVLLNRNLLVLLIAQLISVSGSISFVTLGGIIGRDIAPAPELATLPLSFMVLGTALCTIPVALFMQRHGRRAGFTLAMLSGGAAFAAAAFATSAGSFVWFCAATAAYGFTLATVQQFRFAAAESVPVAAVSNAVALVLLGSIGGAMLGPRLIDFARARDPLEPFAFALYTIAALLAAAAVLIAVLFRNRYVGSAGEPVGERRPLMRVVAQPGYLVALFGGVCSYGVMTLIMTATPISMHVVDGHSMHDTAWVVSSHVVAMYAPSLFSGPLIARFGPRLVMFAGVVLLIASVVFGLQGHAVMHYWQALVALGVGWNFLYVGATTLLTRQYREEERFRAQAFNDFSVFGASALASLASGTAMHLFGWQTLLLLPLPLLGLMCVSLLMLRGKRVAECA